MNRKSFFLVSLRLALTPFPLKTNNKKSNTVSPNNAQPQLDANQHNWFATETCHDSNNADKLRKTNTRLKQSFQRPPLLFNLPRNKLRDLRNDCVSASGNSLHPTGNPITKTRPPIIACLTNQKNAFRNHKTNWKKSQY